ncbi:hypothetical protein GSI_14564 [Ganoderma sinense ZZ0214-1]|uniref:Uncharacterized protein n=1 Tax=Ganoderma sinense ZZ0214-1 TaxID=1077348 RepID=A0A2G8RP01_9APHY|nr:hypothetical protein GSI_14564 [Ganoderma sinense ZZ0214-1]
MEREPHSVQDDHVPRELVFLYPRKPDPYDAAHESERSFFILRPGSDVPPKYPEKTSPPTPYDLVVGFLAKHGQTELLSTLAFVNRNWCRAVRKLRFRCLHLEPSLDFPRLLEVFRPNTVLPFLRQLHLNGRLTSGPRSARDPEHRWLAPLVPLFAHILAAAPVDYLFLQSLSWGNVPAEVRAALLGLPGVRALGIHDVDFWNSNQFLRVLNAHAPRLQFLQIWHATYWAYNHVPSQLQHTEPLLLTELVLGCAYTPLIMEWLLGGGQREVLAIEELDVASRDVYRDDARLARVVKKVAPWLKRFSYNEWGALNGMCEGTNGGDDEEPESDEEMEVDEDDDEYEDGDSDMDEDETGDTDGEEDSGMDEETSERIGDDEDQVTVPGNRTDSAVAGLPRMVEVSNTLLLPDDEENSRMEDGDTEFRNPPFTRKGSDLGRAAFAQELEVINNPDSPMEMPMVESVDGRIYWKSSFNFLTLAMLCRPVYSSEGFYRFDLSISFESVDVFDDAPWRDIDRLLLGITVPERDDNHEDDEDDEITFQVVIAVKGWDLRGKQAKERLKEIRRKLPRTVKKNALRIYVETWSRSPPRPGPREWIKTYM